jgi:hypothetical protein
MGIFCFWKFGPKFGFKSVKLFYDTNFFFMGNDKSGASCLTPKGLRGVFSKKNTPNRPFLAQEALLNFFSFFCTFNRRILY